MTLDPEMFTPQEVSSTEGGPPEALDWPDTIYLDRKRARFLACYLLEAIPRLFDAFYAHRRNVASYVSRQEELCGVESSSENSDSECSG